MESRKVDSNENLSSAVFLDSLLFKEIYDEGWVLIASNAYLSA
jgi:hypothetical protein